MHTRKSFIYLACVVACAGLACQKKIKTSSFIVPLNLKASLGVGAGGTLRWVSEDASGPDFQISFLGESPCEGDANNLPGSPAKGASCKVKSGLDADGSYPFRILPAPKEKPAMSKSADAGQTVDNVYYAHVDGCDGCKAIIVKMKKKLLYPVKATTGDNPDTVHISCVGGTVKVAPPNVNAASLQVLEWSQDGSVKNKWQVDIPPGVCSNGTVFGTRVDGSPIACNLNTGLKPGTVYSYNASLSTCATGTKPQLTIVAP